MYLECVTVCINYGDFLEEIIPFNQDIFDKWVIVTDPNDRHTRSLCHKYSIQYCMTEEHTRNGKFNKGRCVARGLEMLDHHDWIIHLDGDMVLPRKTRLLLEAANLQKDCLYGIDRGMIKGWKEWEKFKNSSRQQHHWQYMTQFPKVPMGARYVTHRDGYVPIGAFQMWHAKHSVQNGIQVKAMPYTQGHAAHYDIQFALQWDRAKRYLIPEIIALHLESEDNRHGKNWHGRKTGDFKTGEVPTPPHHAVDDIYAGY